ncbi:MAG: electron transport complex subunit RsxA [bacterium]|nr:electron transport complex subunit RsxA [bacterium]
MSIREIMTIVISAILINNYVLQRFLGVCPYLGVSKQIETALGMGMAVTFVMAIASAFTWMVQRYVLVPLNLAFLQTIAFILVIAALVQFVELVIRKSSPTLYQALGIYLPLITTNCAVLGVAVINVRAAYGFLPSLVNGTAAAVGFTLAITLMAGIRERIELSDIPPALRGVPITLITAGLLSIAFFGFSGMVK